MRISILMLIIFFICPFSFFLKIKSITDFSPAVKARVFKFYIHPDNCEVCCVRENQDGEIFFFCPSLSCNTKGICIYKISDTQAGVCEPCLLYICYILIEVNCWEERERERERERESRLREMTLKTYHSG